MYSRPKSIVDNMQSSFTLLRAWTIPVWDAPYWTTLEQAQMVEADEAEHMRDDDRVAAVVHDGEARAYPFFIADWYHTIHDQIGDKNVFLCSCERCGTAVTFDGELHGEAPEFKPSALYNATLMLSDVSEGGFDADWKPNFWNHHLGLCMAGEEKGHLLDYIPTSQLTWGTWKELHPDTKVMDVPIDPQHPDPRVGHGRNEYLELHWGVDKFFTSSILERLDERLHENRMVLGVNVPDGVRAYPVREITAAGHAINDSIGDTNVAVWNSPAPDQFHATAFDRDFDGQTLTFEAADEPHRFRDTQTGTLWNFHGEGVEGTYAGERLEPIFSPLMRWHAYRHSHHDVSIYQEAYEPSLDHMPGIRDVAEALQRGGHEVEPELYGDNLTIQPPVRAEDGGFVRIDGDRFWLNKFETVTAAADYAKFQDHTLRTGRFVLRSTPEHQHLDPANSVRRADQVIDWSELLEDEEFVDHFEGIAPEATEDEELDLAGVVERLESAGYDTVIGEISHAAPVDAAQGPVPFPRPREHPVGAVHGLNITIEGDYFQVFIFEDKAAAENWAGSVSKAVASGRYGFRSVPVYDMFRAPQWEASQKPDRQVPWSDLLDDEDFLDAISPERLEVLADD